MTFSNKLDNQNKKKQELINIITKMRDTLLVETKHCKHNLENYEISIIQLDLGPQSPIGIHIESIKCQQCDFLYQSKPWYE